MNGGGISCTIGICAYNEQENIGHLLKSLLDQKLKNVRISQIVVIASGCTDDTERIVLQYQKRSKLIRLIHEDQRRGKVSAVNLFLKNTVEDILVLESADTLPKENTVEKLVSVFADPSVGLAGVRPIPLNKKNSLVGYAVNLQWQLHHLISLKSPKMGEMIAFRRSFIQIDPKSIVDEALLQVIIAAQGYKTCYVPNAIVNNKGPETIRDFLRQTRRNYAGHLVLKNAFSYQVSTLNLSTILKALPQTIEWKPKPLIYLFGTIILEGIGRSFGWYDYYFNKKRRHNIWKIASTTKCLIKNP
jgi:cellulose synthase/poly-beta-1,6-N-acetylglucosamine synthase-like glycosyltransferase